MIFIVLFVLVAFVTPWFDEMSKPENR